MKKIFNWTFGSIFRTFGRIIAYLSVGLLIASILSKTGFKLTDILPIMRVNAAEIVQNVKQVNNGYLTTTSTHSNSTWYTYTQVIDNTNMPDDKLKNFSYVFENPLNVSDFVEFQLLISSPGIADVTTTNIENFCIQWTKSGSSDKYVCSEYNQNTSYSKDNLIYSNLENFSINAYVDYDGGGWTTCSWGSGSSLICPGKNSSNNKGIKQLNIYYSFNSSANSSLTKSFSLNLLRSYINYDLLNDSEVIANIKDSTNDIKDSINNDNVDDSTNTASNFFNNFSTDTHGLTGIITAPLNAIQSLTSKTCSPLVLPLPFVDKDLTLPCMREIYVDNFGAFMNIYDVITLGIISYWVMVRIFALVKDFKNPDHDEIEVMDL